MAIATTSLLRIIGELVLSAGNVVSAWARTKESTKTKDISARLEEIETSYTQQVKLVEEMAKQLSQLASEVQKQIEINNNQSRYLKKLKAAVILLFLFSIICVFVIFYLLIGK